MSIGRVEVSSGIIELRIVGDGIVDGGAVYRVGTVNRFAQIRPGAGGHRTAVAPFCIVLDPGAVSHFGRIAPAQFPEQIENHRVPLGALAGQSDALYVLRILLCISEILDHPVQAQMCALSSAVVLQNAEAPGGSAEFMAAIVGRVCPTGTLHGSQIQQQDMVFPILAPALHHFGQRIFPPGLYHPDCVAVFL